MGFSDIPVRSNGQTVTAAWFNTIRTQLVNWFGAGAITETQDTIDNGASGENVVGLSFDGILYRSAKIQYQVYRTSSIREYVEAGEFFVAYNTTAATWEIGGESAVGDADITFSISAAGQVTYTTGTIGGTSYAGTIRFKAETISVES